MRRLYFLLSIIFFLLSQPVSAHLQGQPPFFKVNGIYSQYYSVPSTSLDTLGLPQDIGPEAYLVGQRLKFELDAAQLAVPQEIIAKTKFKWDFGDGSHSEGLANDHSYAKAGSYILMIYADTSSFERGTSPQLLQSIMLYIVSSKDYPVPRSVFSVNGKSVTDPIGDWLVFKPDETLTFDGSHSAAQSEITSYFWDFGDGTSASGKTVTHKYKDMALVFPLLRIKTLDGFIADSFVEIHNSDELPNQKEKSSADDTKDTDTTTPENGASQKNIYISLVVIVVFIATFFVSRRLLVSKRKRI